MASLTSQLAVLAVESADAVSEIRDLGLEAHVLSLKSAVSRTEVVDLNGEFIVATLELSNEVLSSLAAV